MIKSKVCSSAWPHWKWEGCIRFPPSFAQGYSTSAALPAHGVRCVLSKLSHCSTALLNTQSWQGYRWHPIYNNALQSLMVPQTLMKSIIAGPSQFHCPWSVGILCAAVDLDMSGCLAWDMEDWHYTLTPTQTSAALIMTRSSWNDPHPNIRNATHLGGLQCLGSDPGGKDTWAWKCGMVGTKEQWTSVCWLLANHTMQERWGRHQHCGYTSSKMRPQLFSLYCERAKASVIWAGDGGGTARGTEPDSASTHTVGVTPHS